ncbi:MAG: hypothetical protein ACPG8W_05940 [Candidatus Promineifilaceae bacterium]
MNKHKTSNSNGGWILITIGALFLLMQNVQVTLPSLSEYLILPGMAMMFIVAGLLSRKVGLLVPGGILSGIGATAFLEANPFEWSFVQGVDDATIFFFCFALGWCSIALFALFIERNVQWWALLVGSIFALIGAAITFGGAFLNILEFMSNGWPAILIVIGLWSLFGRENAHKNR